jgi:biotin--protein ligase
MYAVLFPVLSAILIYAGPGASPTSVKNLKSLLPALAPKQTILPVGIEKLTAGGWEETTSLLILPGGNLVEYCRMLPGATSEKIKAYVIHGGSFLALSSGAYYSSNQIVFDGGTNFNIQGAKGLGFFPGTSEGPVKEGYIHCSQKGAQAASIEYLSSSHPIKIYYNGGGYFKNAQSVDQITILARYSTMFHPLSGACIIERRYGKGRIILSHVRIDTPCYSLDAKNPGIATIIEELQPYEGERQNLLKTILGRLIP